MKEQDAVAALRKRKQEELTMMKVKRCRLEADCISFEADADKLAEQAETTSRFNQLIANSNALRRGAKTKRYRNLMQKLQRT